jgi:hypothetical protein
MALGTQGLGSATWSGLDGDPSDALPLLWIPGAVRLRLDLLTFDSREFAPYLRRCRQAGISFTSMAELDDTAARVVHDPDLSRAQSWPE